MAALAQQAMRRFLGEGRVDRATDPFAVGRQSAEVAIAQALELLAGPASAGRADARRRHSFESRDLSPAARLRLAGKVVIVYCTEVLEIIRNLLTTPMSSPMAACRRRWRFADYDHVERLATDIRVSSESAAPPEVRGYTCTSLWFERRAEVKNPGPLRSAYKPLSNLERLATSA